MEGFRLPDPKYDPRPMTILNTLVSRSSRLYHDLQEEIVKPDRTLKSTSFLIPGYQLLDANDILNNALECLQICYVIGGLSYRCTAMINFEIINFTINIWLHNDGYIIEFFNTFGTHDTFLKAANELAEKLGISYVRPTGLRKTPVFEDEPQSDHKATTFFKDYRHIINNRQKYEATRMLAHFGFITQELLEDPNGTKHLLDNEDYIYILDYFIKQIQENLLGIEDFYFRSCILLAIFVNIIKLECTSIEWCNGIIPIIEKCIVSDDFHIKYQASRAKDAFDEKMTPEK